MKKRSFLFNRYTVGFAPTAFFKGALGEIMAGGDITQELIEKAKSGGLVFSRR